MEYMKGCLLLIGFVSLGIMHAFVDSQENYPTQKPIQRNPDTDILHEIDIRLELQKSVQSLIKDVAILKNDRDTLKVQVSSLVSENKLLKQQYLSLKSEFDTLNSSCCGTESHTDKENMLSTVDDLSKKYRYLSLSLLDLHSKTDKINESNAQIAKEISDRISAEVTNVSNAILKTNNSLIDVQENISTINHTLSSSITNTDTQWTTNAVRMNTSISNLRTSLLRTEHEQAKISAALTTLQQNYSTWLAGSRRKIHFSAGMKSPDSFSLSKTIIFPKVITNMGNAYNSNTGVFTSPTDGTFVFYFSTYVSGSSSNRIDIVLNGESKAPVYNNEKSGWEESSSLVVLQLKTGDNVWIKYGMGSSSIYADINVMPIFSGFMI